MLGRHSPQGELFRPDNVHLDHVGRDSFYGFMAKARHQLFKDVDFAGLYRKDHGRPSVPPSQLCIALLLQAREGVSDDEAIQRTAYDLRWKVALGLEVGEKLCAKSTLQLFRAKLILHDEYQTIFKKSIAACRASGLLKRKKLEVAIDTTPVFGCGAVKDTFNLISDQIRRVATDVAKLKDLDLDELVADHGLGRHFGTSFKGSADLDWHDEQQRRALVSQLVADARIAESLGKQALRGFAKGAEKTQSLRQAIGLLQDLLLQDVDEAPEDDGGPTIRKGTARDRIVSTTDPEMRHGRKSHSTMFKGYKSSLVVDTDDGVALATDARQANVHDKQGAAELVEEAARNAKVEIESALGDMAYGAMETRRQFAKRGIEIVAKAPPPGNKSKIEFTIDTFELDEEQASLTCPAGKQSIRRDRRGKDGWAFVFSRDDCNVCPMRAKCTTAKVSARVVAFTPDTLELRRLRTEQQASAFRSRCRRRVIVEHRFARLLQLGIRKARFFGLRKVAFQISIAAAVANLGLAMNAMFCAVLVALRPLLRATRSATVELVDKGSSAIRFA